MLMKQNSLSLPLSRIILHMHHELYYSTVVNEQDMLPYVEEPGDRHTSTVVFPLDALLPLDKSQFFRSAMSDSFLSFMW